MKLRHWASLIAGTSLLALTACQEHHEQSGSQILSQSDANAQADRHSLEVPREAAAMHSSS